MNNDYILLIEQFFLTATTGYLLGLTIRLFRDLTNQL